MIALGALITAAIDPAATTSITGIKSSQVGIPAARNVVVCEVLVYEWQTSPEENAAIMAYLSAKYAIPINV